MLLRFFMLPTVVYERPRLARRREPARPVDPEDAVPPAGRYEASVVVAAGGTVK
jgi:hypothetical protein